MIIAGYRTFRKILGQEENLSACDKCGNNVRYIVTRQWKWITFFWIPIIPLVWTYYILCPICGAEYKVSKKDAMALMGK